MDEQEKKKRIENLKEMMRTRGVNPEPYMSVLVQYQKLLDGIKSHEEIVVAMNVVEALAWCTGLKHMKFHNDGGKNERAFSDFN